MLTKIREQAAREFLRSRPTDKNQQLFDDAGLTVTSQSLTCTRAMGVGEPTAGATARPTNLADSLVAAFDLATPVRDAATLIPFGSGGPLSIPTCNDVANTGDQPSENEQDGDDDDFIIDAVELSAYKFTSRVAASNEFVVDAGPGVQSQLGKLLGKRVGRKINAALTVGLGVDEPEGIVTASALGKAAAGDDTLTYADLVDLQFSIDAGYQASAAWMMSLSTLRAVAGIVDGAQRPLFMPLVVAGAPNFAGFLLGAPIVINPAMPALAAGNKPILYGDFSAYMVRETNLELVYQREAKAELHQVVLVAMCRCDGRLTDATAVKHLRMASS